MKFSIFFSACFVCALASLGCNASSDESPQTQTIKMGVLPSQTPELLAAEWDIYRQRHADQDEATARQNFDELQLLSAIHYDPNTAAWAERQAFANAWLKTQIEDVYSPESIPDEMILAAIDAYAFKSGNPSLVTASHILIKPNSQSTPEERLEALNKIRQKLIDTKDYSNEALSREAQHLTLAGFRTDFNNDLTFPRFPMTSFMGEQLSYRAVVEPFAAAAFALSDDNRLSPVTESEFGYHLILFQSKTEEKKADISKDRIFIINHIIEQGRSIATRQAIDALMHTTPIEINELRLKAMASMHETSAE